MIMLRLNSCVYLTTANLACLASEWAELCCDFGVVVLYRIQANTALVRKGRVTC